MTEERSWSMLTEKERREMRRADRYALSVRNCARDIIAFGPEDGAPILMSPTRESADKFMAAVKKEIERILGATP